MKGDKRLIKELIDLLKDDSRASSHDKEYADQHLSQYLKAIIKKDSGLLHGILVALEKHLEI